MLFYTAKLLKLNEVVDFQLISRFVRLKVPLTTEVEQFRFDLLQNNMSVARLNVVSSPNIGTFLNKGVRRMRIIIRVFLRYKVATDN